MKLSKRGGFTLVELIIAATLLAAVAGAIFGALVSANRFPRPELDRSSGTNLAREKLEELSEAVRQDWWPNNGQPLSPGNSAVENITVDGATYQRSYRVENVAGKDYRRATMKVTPP